MDVFIGLYDQNVRNAIERCTLSNPKKKTYKKNKSDGFRYHSTPLTLICFVRNIFRPSKRYRACFFSRSILLNGQSTSFHNIRCR